MREKLPDYIKYFRDDTERACIRAVCSACNQGQMSAPHPTLGSGPWLHSGLSICNAFGIYELRRKRDSE